jgi:fructose-1,6-bisphosphatase/inositol monophosphatase family enzyme
VNLRPYLEFGVQTAYEAGRLTLGYFGTEAARPEFKADDTPVTVADREAGGYFGDWSGNETIYSGEAMSTTRSLLPEVLSLIESR